VRRGKRESIAGPRIVPHKLHGHDALRIANGIIEAEILPLVGAKIWPLSHLDSNIQWIWHRPVIVPAIVDSAAVYDDVWPGGWEELFPNDAPGKFGSAFLTDHGEWWRRPWRIVRLTETAESATIALALNGETVQATYEKWISLAAGSSELVVRYKIRNISDSPLVSLFKQHLPVAITPAHQLELPGGNLVPVDPLEKTIVNGPGPHRWPVADGSDGSPVDLRRIPSASASSRAFLYVTDMPEGWCGVRDGESGHAIRLHYRLDVFPFTWLFMTYGGWRGLYTIVLEPCTNMPKDLTEAHRWGQSLVLGPEQSFECTVRAQLT
jgi:hypothetical protein